MNDESNIGGLGWLTADNKRGWLLEGAWAIFCSRSLFYLIRFYSLILNSRAILSLSNFSQLISLCSLYKPIFSSFLYFSTSYSLIFKTPHYISKLTPCVYRRLCSFPHTFSSRYLMRSFRIFSLLFFTLLTNVISRTSSCSRRCASFELFGFSLYSSMSAWYSLRSSIISCRPKMDWFNYLDFYWMNLDSLDGLAFVPPSFLEYEPGDLL